MKMRSQKVSVDLLKMILSTCSYLLLAVLAWILLRLVNACFCLPGYLKAKEKKAKDAQRAKIAEVAECENKKQS